MCSRILVPLLCITLLAAVGGCSRSEQPAEKTEQTAAAASPAPAESAAQARALAKEKADAEARVAKLLERVVSVLDGYQAFTGHYPQQFEDLNQGGYFFDLAYLADLVAPPFKAYILLGGSAQPYRVWVVDGKNQVAMEQVAGGAPQSVAAAPLGGLVKEFQPRSLAANVIGLAPRAAAKGGAG
ncbi:hypothetical protein JCM30471_18060 [Desulfuromonas carbonis]